MGVDPTVSRPSRGLLRAYELSDGTFSSTIDHCTHPHKKGPVMEIYARHLTSFSMVIYQAEHNLWCPGNGGWENFAQLQKFQVK